LLITKNLKEINKNTNLYPYENDVNKILELDTKNKSAEIDMAEVEKAYQIMKNTLETQGLRNMVMPFDNFQKQYEYSVPVKSKNNTFHYLPYNFGGADNSRFELQILQKTLLLNDFKNSGLEIYYNGERGLTEFVISCFAKNGKYWKNIGKYTTDFLIIKRKDKSIHKVLLIEAKGTIYAKDEVFKQKKSFVETEFLKLNREKFGYQKFDFLYLEDSKTISQNTVKLNEKINEFFNRED
jgi:hypothetical protein